MAGLQELSVLKTPHYYWTSAFCPPWLTPLCWDTDCLYGRLLVALLCRVSLQDIFRAFLQCTRRTSQDQHIMLTGVVTSLHDSYQMPLSFQHWDSMVWKCPSQLHCHGGLPVVLLPGRGLSWSGPRTPPSRRPHTCPSSLCTGERCER